MGMRQPSPNHLSYHTRTQHLIVTEDCRQDPLAQLKEKFLVNFLSFQADVSTEEDFFSYQQYERETLPDFFRRFLRLKVQAPEVSDKQAIMQAIKALHAGQLHSHLVRLRPRTLEELYEEFWKFSRAEVLHFRKLGQQRKSASKNESSRPFKYHRHPSQYYQPYNYTPHTSQVHTPQPTISYPLAHLQIMYPAASSQTTQPKTEPNNPPLPPPHNQESSQQATSFPAFETIHTITGVSNFSFENKRQRREYYRQVNHVAIKGPIV
jgi:hypothetical protein